MVRSVLRWGVGLSLCALVTSTGCGDACEDDGFGGANCPSTNPIAQDPSTGAQTSTGADDSSSTTGDASTQSTTDEESTSTSTGDVGVTTWCADADSDGFGDANDCQDVRDDERPPSGAVQDDTDCDDTSERTFPGAATKESAGSCTKDADDDGWGDTDPPDGVDPGTDCLDDDADTFPGAAELDDVGACMRDADDDGYGDSLPPAGADAGTDCADDDADVPSASACLTWCADADEDEYGDPNTCVSQVDPPKGYVGNDADCDDTTAEAFPGAAPNDDAMACMLDADGDDYGDATPENAAIAAGSDCDDLELLVFDACFDCPADTFFCNDDDNSAQCNSTGTFAVEVDACGFGCDDGSGACWTALTVDPGTCVEMLAGESASLDANAMGGDGDYEYTWAPNDTLSVDDAAVVEATPNNPTSYTLDVSDGEGNTASERVTVHLTDQDWFVDVPECQSFSYADIFGGAAPPPNNMFFNGGEAHCNLAANSVPNAFVCPQIMEESQVSFDLIVANNADDDGIGFVYGWQDASHFYLFSWNSEADSAPWGTWEQGVTIKRIEADDPADITGEDLGASYDTAHGTILATPSTFHSGGWTNQILYRVTVEFDGDDTTISIVDDLGALVTSGTVSDAVLGPGAIGGYSASQRTVCTDNWSSSCGES